MRNIFITMKKELRGIFRDKKFVSIILFMPLIIPMFIILMGHFYDTLDGEKEAFTVGVNYDLSENEYNIMKSINENIEIKYESDSKVLADAFNNDEIDAYILLTDGVYNICLDSSSQDGMTLQSTLNIYFEQYNNYLANNKLVEMNVNPEEVFNIAKYEFRELAKEGTNFFTNFMVSFALVYLVMIITVTAMNTSTDIIAGEKERGTFETLLTFPLKSNEIMCGKLLAIVTSCIISSLIGVSTSIPAFMHIRENTKTFAGMNLDFSIPSILLAILTLVIISCLVGVVCIFLCGKAKTFKEAQSKVSILSFLSMIPMFTSTMGTSSDILYMIPVSNGGVILNDLFINGIKMNNFLIFSISSIIITILLLVYVSKQYKDEKALF